MATIVVDAGHGGYDNGAMFNGRLEKDDNLALALEVGTMLENAGFDVLFTRTEDIYQTPSEKARIANDNGADYFISIHRNSSEFPNQYSGVQSLIFSEGGIRQQMGENINANLEQLGFPNLGISIRPNLTVLRRTRMPSVLVEAGFINNEQDNQIFDERFEEIARGITDGIIQAVGMPGVPYGELTAEFALSMPNGMNTGTQMPKYWILTGLFTREAEANAQAAQVRQAGHSAQVIMLGEFFAVVAGPYNTLPEAGRHAAQLTRAGYDASIIIV